MTASTGLSRKWERLYRIKDAMRELSCSRATIYKYLGDKKLRAVRRARNTLIVGSTLRQLIESLPEVEIKPLVRKAAPRPVPARKRSMIGHNGGPPLKRPGSRKPSTTKRRAAATASA